ncbi:polyketide synthase [Mycobacterium sp. CBMA271]|uniref:beta-ketoacyl [acyl carrier protein] synthase domain-containing protein n=1 Tax=unclassified Mycobacteroides TaxID=2618759 RepID=UPI0012DC4F79|nr:MULTISPECIES: polyketide synthase [unclassified Mycobacteroides]MUM18702.1 beta-ketoacyl synthase [Mycobacteroides sp. CBMA 326]MUM22664.1 polyketide synthase [Mycobacteroides sp. CBMA 271]
MSTDTDPVVISGMAIEAPGGIDTTSAFWNALADGRELIGPFPRDRDWPIDELLSLSDRDGWGNVSDAGGFLTDATIFDPGFYGFTQREAVAMDPQQRIGMRVAWRALENAGLNPNDLDGAEAACFIGASPNEYGPRAGEINAHSGHRVVGGGQLGIAGRISHGLGLVGPSMCVDSACASSLSALHLAASAVRADECEWALAGGVCVMGSPGGFFEFSKLHALDPDGHCRSYSDEANGTLWGEAAGMVVLERESRARELGHRVYGRIMAIRTNHNGGGKPILVPRGRAQAKLVAATIAASGIDPADVGMLEGHGTGTRAGDPLEIMALQSTYGAGGSQALLGSAKSNAGHAQSAAGMVGLIKLLLSGQNGHIPPTLYADNPTTRIDWNMTGIRLSTKLHSWEPKNGIRYGAVSSFGAGGANAHAIIAMPDMGSGGNDV